MLESQRNSLVKKMEGLKGAESMDMMKWKWKITLRRPRSQCEEITKKVRTWMQEAWSKGEAQPGLTHSNPLPFLRHHLIFVRHDASKDFFKVKNRKTIPPPHARQRICKILYFLELWNMYSFKYLLQWQVIFLGSETLIWDKEGFQMKSTGKETGKQD